MTIHKKSYHQQHTFTCILRRKNLTHDQSLPYNGETFVTWWNQLDYSKLNPLVEQNIILGFPRFTPEDQVLNVCLIVAKYYIYCSKRHNRHGHIIIPGNCEKQTCR